MTAFLKSIHILGVAMFLGSILGHVVVGFVPGKATDPQVSVFVRQAIVIATDILTLPGLLLLAVTGLIMLLRRGRKAFSARWLVIHTVFGLLIILNAGAVLYPAGTDCSPWP